MGVSAASEVARPPPPDQQGRDTISNAQALIQKAAAPAPCWPAGLTPPTKPPAHLSPLVSRPIWLERGQDIAQSRNFMGHVMFKTT